MFGGKISPVSLQFFYSHTPPLTSGEIILLDYMACESVFLAGRALLSECSVN